MTTLRTLFVLFAPVMLLTMIPLFMSVNGSFIPAKVIWVVLINLIMCQSLTAIFYGITMPEEKDK